MLREQKNVRHLSFLKRVVKRVQNCIIEALGANCPQKLQEGYQLFSQRVDREDDVYLVSQKSELTAQVDEWDKKRDNTYVGVRTMADALQRIGTQEQQEAATKVLERIGQHKIDVNDRYEDEGEKLAQLVQDLQGPLAAQAATLGLTSQVAVLKEQNDQTEHYLELRQNERADQTPQAMMKARTSADEAYELMVTLINSFAVVESVNGVSPYDTCISYVNSDIKYYVDHVFYKKKGSGGSVPDDDSDVNPDPTPTPTPTPSDGGSDDQGGGGSDQGGGSEEGGDTPTPTPGGDTPTPDPTPDPSGGGEEGGDPED